MWYQREEEAETVRVIVWDPKVCVEAKFVDNGIFAPEMKDGLSNVLM